MLYKEYLIVLYLIFSIALFSSIASLAQPANMNEEPTVITLMVVYTENARLLAKERYGFGSIDNAIAQGVAYTNNSFENSGVNLRVELVHSAQVDYESSGSSVDDLRRLRSKDMDGEYGGYMLEVHEWRDEYKADLVKILTPGVGGLGFLPRIPDPSLGFSRTGVGNAHIHVFPHEIGHNLGLHHSRLQPAYSPGQQGGIFEYSTGWLWEPEEGNPNHSSDRYGSIMCVINENVAAPHFSNPDIKHKGKQTGSYEGEGAPADNARSLRETKHFFAGYRGPASEEDSLFAVKFYESLNGDNWHDNKGWLDSYLRNWNGLIVAKRVFAIQLDDNGLSGRLDPSIGNFKKLARLDLSGNQLTGAIPTEITNIKNLARLDLSGNHLTGSIPTEIGNLEMLSFLLLSGNQLTGSIPPEINNMERLSRLDLSGNQLTGSISPEINNIERLAWLDLSGNQFTGNIPSEIGSLEILRSLNLIDNQLTGSIPPEIGNLEMLNFLGLTGNQLTGAIPTELTNLNLEFFYFDANKLCVPSDQPFSDWLNNISYVNSTNVHCDDVFPETVVQVYPYNKDKKPLRLTLIWEESLNADNYHIQISTDDGFHNIIIDSTQIISEKISIMNLEKNQKYYWRVRASNDYFGDDWWNEWSDTWTFTTAGVYPPQFVTLVSPENGAENTSITPLFNWEKVDVADHYEFTIARDEEFEELLFETVSVEGTGLSLDKKLAYQNQYWWRVRGVNPGGTGDWSESWSFKTKIDPIPDDFTLQQNFPNPFNPNTQINFDLPEQAEVNLSVYNALGQRVATLAHGSMQAGRYDVTFDASGLSSGLYIYRLEAGSFVETRKMMYVK